MCFYFLFPKQLKTKTGNQNQKYYQRCFIYFSKSVKYYKNYNIYTFLKHLKQQL